MTYPKDYLDHLSILKSDISGAWKASLTVTVVAIGWVLFLKSGEKCVTDAVRYLVSFLYLPVIIMCLISICKSYSTLSTFLNYAHSKNKICQDEDTSSYMAQRIESESVKYRLSLTVLFHIFYVAIFCYLVWFA